MEEERNKNLQEQLSSGEKVTCPKCNSGFLEPFNTTPDKAHSFNCSNKDCANRYHWDPIIDIE